MEFSQYIKPELLVLVPVLCFIGAALKKSDKVRNENIPLALGCAGVVLALLWVLSTADWACINAFKAVFTAVIQGIMCAGAAVYGHQVVKPLTNQLLTHQK